MFQQIYEAARYSRDYRQLNNDHSLVINVRAARVTKIDPRLKPIFYTFERLTPGEFGEIKPTLRGNNLLKLILFSGDTSPIGTYVNCPSPGINNEDTGSLLSPFSATSRT
jgi:hypothetical protein